MGYKNSLLQFDSGRKLRSLPKEDRERIAAVFRDLRAEANTLAELNWKRRKAPVAAYHRAVSTYARHFAHALTRPLPQGED